MRTYCSIKYFIGICLIMCLLPEAFAHPFKDFRGGIHVADAGNLKGTVFNDYGRPVQGVLVQIKGRGIEVVTNETGSFEINTNPEDILIFKHPLYNVEEVKVSQKKELMVRLIGLYLKGNYMLGKSYKADTLGLMIPAAQKLDVLYGQVNPESLLGSIATVYSSQLSTTPASLYLYALPGRLPGLNVVQTRGFNSAQTGSLTDVNIFLGNIPKNQSGLGPSDNTEFSLGLRGHGVSNGQSPVTLIDGVQRDLYSIDPESIESISIAKDALSSILLGQNSSRGALLVTTLKPEAGLPRVSFTAESGVQNSLGLSKPLPAYQYAYLLNEALLNDGKKPIYSTSDFNAYKNGTNPLGHPDVNWYNTIMQKDAPISRYNLNISGGGVTARYIVAMNYLDQAGMFKTSPDNSYNTNAGLKRYMINSKIDVDFNKNLNVALQIFGRMQEGNQPGATTSSVLQSLTTTPNNAYPVFNANGSYGGSSIFNQNLLAKVISSGYIANYDRDVMANLDLKYKLDNFVPGLWLKAKGNISVQSSYILNRSKQVPVFAMAISNAGDTTYNRNGSTVNQSNNYTSTAWSRYWYGQVSMGYDKQIGNHNLSTMLMYDQRRVFLNYDIPASMTNYALKSTYNYKNKYFADGALVYGGYSRYAPGHQYGLFYAGGAGWDIAKENFVKDNIEWINHAKLRVTYGQTGNANIDNYSYFGWRTFYTGVAGTYPIGSTYPNGGGNQEQNGTLSNVSATWEKANKLNVGLDLSMLQNHLQVNVDYYNERYFDVLMTRGKSIALMGLNYPNENIGIDLYTGSELSLTYQNNIRSFNYFITGNAAIQNSKLIYMDEQPQRYPWQLRTGGPVNRVMGLIAEGYYLTPKDLTEASWSGYTPHVGDIKYKDLNSDGIIDGNDVAPIGKQRPLIYYGLTMGFNVKGLEFSLLIQGRLNQYTFSNSAWLDEGFVGQGSGYQQAYEQALGRWTPETASTAVYPRLTAGGNSVNFTPYFPSTFYLHNGNYLRLKNISIAYNLPYSWTRRVKLSGVKIFANAQNLYTYAVYGSVDPEVGVQSYPMQKVINIGINIKL